MFNDSVELHPNDKKNLRKHARMERRLAKGNVNPRCKWFKRRNQRAA